MADWYVEKETSPSAGNSAFTEAGTSTNPFRDMNAVAASASAADNVYISGTSAASPLQTVFTDAVGVNIVPTTKQFLTELINLNQGEIFELSEYSTYCQDTSNFTSVTGTVAQDAVENAIGTNCLVIGNGADTSRVNKNNLRLSRGKFRIRIVAKAASGDYVGFRIKINGGNYLDISTGTWDATSAYNEIITATTYEEWVSDWFDCSVESGHEYQIGGATGNVCYLQRVIVEWQADWTQHSGDIYKTALPNFSSTNVVNFLIKDGTDFLTKTTFDTDIATTVSNMAAGEFYHNWTNGATAGEGILYYRLASGETSPNSLNLKAVRGEDVINVTSGTTNLANLNITGGDRGVEVTSAANCNLYDVDISYSYVDWLYSNSSGTTNWYNGVCVHCGDNYASGDGVLSSSSGTVNLFGVNASYCGDEIYQVNQTATLNMYGCFGEYASLTGAGNPISQEGTAALAVYGGAFRCNDGETIAIIRNGGTGGTVHVQDAVLIQNGAGSIYTAGSATLTSSNNYNGGDGANSNTVNGLTSTNITPSEHLTSWNSGLPEWKSTSTALYTGTKQNAMNVAGANGEPYSNFDTDPGFQSKHSPFHPRNL